MAIVSELDDALLHVVVDLAVKLMLEFLFQLLRIRDAEIVVDESLFIEEVSMLLEQLDDTFVNTADLVPMNGGYDFECGRKWKIGGAPDAVGDIA